MPIQIQMVYYTDPYCAWSWAFEGTLEALKDEQGDSLRIEYRQYPLIPDLQKSGKTAEDVAKAWEEVGRITGVPINPKVWRENPPSSTLPACRASKAAATLGEDAEGRFLKALRPLLLVQGRVANRETLVDAAQSAGLDREAFLRALDSPGLDEALRDDEEQARQDAVGSTPSLVLRNPSKDKIQIQGPRDLSLFRRAIAVLRAETEAAQSPRLTVSALLASYESPLSQS